MTDASQENIQIYVSGSSEEHLNQKEHCICRVPRDLYQVKPEAFEPSMVLIGPLQHARKQEVRRAQDKRYKVYVDMEEQKQRYYESFKRRVKADPTGFCQTFIATKEERIRSCYAESTSSISYSEFESMILLDAIFVIEFMLRRYFGEKEHQNDLVFSIEDYESKINSDLILLENQLPYFVIEEIFRMTCHMGGLGGNFRKLSCKYFDMELDTIPEDKQFKHLTDLIRYRRTKSLQFPTKGTRYRCPDNVEKLCKSGVKFVMMESKDEYSINIVFEGGQLRIPHLTINANTEVELRNIIPQEQCYHKDETYLCDYALLLQSLIKTDKDVEILEKNGILSDYSGHDRSLVDMVSSLADRTTHCSACYSDYIEGLIRYHESPWNRIIAAVRHNSLNDTWKAIAGFISAVVLVCGLIEALSSAIGSFKGLENPWATLFM